MGFEGPTLVYSRSGILGPCPDCGSYDTWAILVDGLPTDEAGCRACGRTRPAVGFVHPPRAKRDDVPRPPRARGIAA
jgi:hypothetical protein